MRNKGVSHDIEFGCGCNGSRDSHVFRTAGLAARGRRLVQQARRGEPQAWGGRVHPDSTDAAGVTFVEGPATPPLGRGSLELYTPEMSDRALAFAVPTGAPGGDPLATPWTGLSASYATFIPDGASRQQHTDAPVRGLSRR